MPLYSTAVTMCAFAELQMLMSLKRHRSWKQQCMISAQKVAWAAAVMTEMLHSDGSKDPLPTQNCSWCCPWCTHTHKQHVALVYTAVTNKGQSNAASAYKEPSLCVACGGERALPGRQGQAHSTMAMREHALHSWWLGCNDASVEALLLIRGGCASTKAEEYCAHQHAPRSACAAQAQQQQQRQRTVAAPFQCS